MHDYPEMLYWDVIEGPTEDLKGMEEYYSLKLPAMTDRVKGVTAIILKDSPSQTVLPKTGRREGKDWIGVRTVDNGKVTDLYINQLADGRLMHLNSWIEADGWTTDAYMFTVTYDEGTDPAKNSEVNIIYGSSLRRDGKVYHSSYSKQNVLGTVKNGSLKVKKEQTPSVK